MMTSYDPNHTHLRTPLPTPSSFDAPSPRTQEPLQMPPCFYGFYDSQVTVNTDNRGRGRDINVQGNDGSRIEILKKECTGQASTLESLLQQIQSRRNIEDMDDSQLESVIREISTEILQRIFPGEQIEEARKKTKNIFLAVRETKQVQNITNNSQNWSLGTRIGVAANLIGNILTELPSLPSETRKKVQRLIATIPPARSNWTLITGAALAGIATNGHLISPRTALLSLIPLTTLAGARHILGPTLTASIKINLGLDQLETYVSEHPYKTATIATMGIAAFFFRSTINRGLIKVDQMLYGVQNIGKTIAEMRRTK